ncbi:hypothetical protein QUA00_24545 [Microcoleus sp. T2B6]|uniref:hypothetical protein n=1 Tax=Microcoleus sp. T2B6 TaxID=3055424 RepID=UPI002FCFDDD7
MKEKTLLQLLNRVKKLGLCDRDRVISYQVIQPLWVRSEECKSSYNYDDECPHYEPIFLRLF